MNGVSSDIVVIGGGIVGAAVADAFARDGATVSVIEAGPIGGGATAAGMGHVVVMDDSEAQYALGSYSQRLWDELAPELPTGAEFERPGTVWIATDDDEMAEASRKERYYQERGIDARVLDARGLYDAEPHLAKGLAGGLLVPGDSVVYPPVVAAFLLKRAEANVVKARAVSLADDGVVLESGERITGDWYVNAAGAGAVKLSPRLPIRPRKGHLVITDRYPGLVSHQLVELGYLKSAHNLGADSVAFNVQPRKTGQLLIGSSRQMDVTDPEIDFEIARRMLVRAISYLPALASLNIVRAWTGFRAATPDKLPRIGRDPQFSKVLVAAGHEGLGITTSLGTGQLLADLVAGRQPEIDPSPFAVKDDES